MRELIARPREIAAGLPEPVGTSQSVSVGLDVAHHEELAGSVGVGTEVARIGNILSQSERHIVVGGGVGQSCDARPTLLSARAQGDSCGGGVVGVSFQERRAAPPAPSAVLVSSGCAGNAADMDREGEGRVLVARPRALSAPDEEPERVLPVRPRDINAPAPPAPAPAATPGEMAALRTCGPRGLALPEWKEEFLAEKARVEDENKRRAVEGGHLHGFGGGREYWDAYYSDPAKFAGAHSREWYCSAETLRPHLVAAAPALRPEMAAGADAPRPSQGRVAVELGCGTSMLSTLLEDLGYVTLAIDFSHVSLREAAADLSGGGGAEGGGVGTTAVLADVCKLPLRSGSADLIVDKATLDTILCTPAGRDAQASALREAARVLRPGGVLISVSHHSRIGVLQSLGLPFSLRETRVWNASAHDAGEGGLCAHVHLSVRLPVCLPHP